MNAYKEEIIRESGTDEKGQPAERTSIKKVEDAVYTLVLTILEHFNGKLIGTCTQEGLNLCNELKLLLARKQQ